MLLSGLLLAEVASGVRQAATMDGALVGHGALPFGHAWPWEGGHALR